MPYPYTEEKGRALRAFRNHRMTIEHDDGVHRCLYFGQPGTMNYHFRLTTWPGHICISGDIGTHVFARLRDMFEFHASADDWASMPLEINASYWAEKLETEGGGRRSVQDQYIDVPHVKQMAVEAFREISIDDFDEGCRVKAFQELRSEVLNYLSEDDSAEHVAGMLDGFIVPSYYTNTHRTLRLVDGTSWEWGLTRSEYGFSFLMCCYAIVWGIKRYAQHKDGRTQADHDRAVLAGEL